MPSVTELRQAAKKIVDDYADYDTEYDYYQALVSDEQFGTFAHCKQQLRAQTTHGGLSEDVQESTDRASEELQQALDERAEEVKKQVEE